MRRPMARPHRTALQQVAPQQAPSSSHDQLHPGQFAPEQSVPQRPGTSSLAHPAHGAR